MNIAGPVVLAILDGWGIAPPSPGNAVTLARTPNFHAFDTKYLKTQLQASGRAVGLGERQDGNSEAGHMNIGAGRVVVQENVRISEAINNGTFFRNPAFLAALQHVQKHHSTLHIMGMLGDDESAHANPDHLLALLMFAQNHHLRHIKLHLFTDGRDSPRYFARKMISKFLPHLGEAQIATVMGRYYGMDRNKNWDRTEMAYRAMTEGVAPHSVEDPLDAISQAYNRDETDEFIVPTVIDNYQGMKDGDAIIFFNLRSDRARQIAKCFVQDHFEQQNATTKPFTRRKIINQLTFVAMTDFGPDLGNMLTAYPAEMLQHTLPMALAHRRQLYIAESEKYAHVTYFFNGGYPDPVGGEERVMIPSPTLKSFADMPGMRTPELAARVAEAVKAKAYDFIVVNFANTDMVAHTGNLQAGVKAMEIADAGIGVISQAVLAADGLLVITGDHGNLEGMINLTTKEVDTEHSNFPVPFYLISQRLPGLTLRAGGKLPDIAPTLLHLMGEPIPQEMTGQVLVRP